MPLPPAPCAHRPVGGVRPRGVSVGAYRGGERPAFERLDHPQREGDRQLFVVEPFDPELARQIGDRGMVFAEDTSGERHLAQFFNARLPPTVPVNSGGEVAEA